MDAIIETEKLSHVYSAGTPFERGALIDVDFTAYRGFYDAAYGTTALAAIDAAEALPDGGAGSVAHALAAG